MTFVMPEGDGPGGAATGPEAMMRVLMALPFMHPGAFTRAIAGFPAMNSPDMARWTMGLPTVAPQSGAPAADGLALDPLAVMRQSLALQQEMLNVMLAFWGMAPATRSPQPAASTSPAPAPKREAEVIVTPIPVVSKAALEPVQGPGFVQPPAPEDLPAVVGAGVAVRVTAADIPTEPETCTDTDDEPLPEAPELFARPHGAADNLERIRGIGPKLHRLLNDLGIWHFRQIASWTPAEVAWVNGQIAFKGRIQREAWISQARRLAAEAEAA